MFISQIEWIHRNMLHTTNYCIKTQLFLLVLSVFEFVDSWGSFLFEASFILFFSFQATQSGMFTIVMKRSEKNIHQIAIFKYEWSTFSMEQWIYICHFIGPSLGKGSESALKRFAVFSAVSLWLEVPLPFSFEKKMSRRMPNIRNQTKYRI